MEIGKLTNEQLDSVVLSAIRSHGADILLSSAIGEDCAAIAFGDEACVLSTDPITVPTEGAAELSIIVSANDVASAGARPVAALLTILAPPETSIDEIRSIVVRAGQQAAEMGLEIIGGHTEITDAVKRTVLSVTVIGKVEKKSLLKTSGAGEGNDIVMTKYAGIEGTRIMLGEQNGRFASMLSVVNDALIAAKNGACAMHDATEGGILGAAWELANAANLTVRIDLEAIPVLPETMKECKKYGLNPYRLISSGSILIACENGEAMCRALEAAGIHASVIGRMTTDGHKTVRGDVEQPLDPPGPDEIYKWSAKNE